MLFDTEATGGHRFAPHPLPYTTCGKRVYSRVSQKAKGAAPASMPRYRKGNTNESLGNSYLFEQHLLS